MGSHAVGTRCCKGERSLEYAVPTREDNLIAFWECPDTAAKHLQVLLATAECNGRVLNMMPSKGLEVVLAYQKTCQF